MSAADQPEPEKLPAWARKALATVSSGESRSPAATKTAGDLIGSAMWPYMTRAALVGSFLPRQLAGSGESTVATLREISAAILDFAERASGPDGIRWALTPDARRSVIGAASSTDIADALDWTAASEYFHDEVSEAMRAQIREPMAPERSTLPQLEAQRLAASWLGEKRHPQAPTLETLDHEVAVRRLMAPIYHMIGVREPDGTPVDLARIPFFGRREELDTLDDYVGVVTRRSVVGQLITNIARSVLGPKPPVVVYGGGGTGKTTLIARFLLEHAQKAQSRFPFVYLDFDRTAVSMSRPALLVLEMCVQVRAQFPELAPQLIELEGQARALSARLDGSPSLATTELETLSQVGGLLNQFRDLIDGHMARLENTFEFLRPFLLVIDTFEVVQYEDSARRRLESFVFKLVGGTGKGIGNWPRLRLIVSGRKHPKTFLEALTEVRLASLKEPEAVAMLLRLAREAARPIDESMARQLLAAVKEADRLNESVLSPLRIRLIGELFVRKEGAAEADTDADGNTIARRLIAELRDPKLSGTVRRKLIEGVLIQRILDHIANDDVRALADPGLVVRRFTPEVIRAVMAPGTPKPGSEPADLPSHDPRYDSLEFEPWMLSPAEADKVFEAFGKEARLVERDGPYLRHRQDVREDMLPLIRASRPNRFKNLHRLAFKFYDDRIERHRRGENVYGEADTTARDRANRAAGCEALYHGLWLGMPTELLDRFWPDIPDVDPRLVEEEFDDPSEARSYVIARNGKRLTRQDLDELPQRLAARWVVARDSQWLAESDANESVELVRQATAPDYKGLDDHPGTAAIVARLLYRAGDWRECATLIDRQLAGDGYAAMWRIVRDGTGWMGLEDYKRVGHQLSSLRTLANLTARTGGDPRPLELGAGLAACDGLNLDEMTRIELAAYAVLGARRRGVVEGTAETQAYVQKLAQQIDEGRWRQNEITLRLSILCTERQCGSLIAAYLEHRGLVEPDRAVLSEAAYALALALSKTGEPGLEQEAIDAGVAYGYRPSDESELHLRRLWNGHAGRIIDVVRDNADLQDKMRRVILFDHHDWSRPLGHALSRARRDTTLWTALAGRLRSVGLDGGAEGSTIVQTAIDRGALSALVDAILAVAPVAKTDRPIEAFPASVFDHAAALHGWHTALLQSMGGRSMPSS
jgi:hypothetical protein